MYDMIGKIGVNSDTFNYALKYIYNLSDYNPIKYHQFLSSNNPPYTVPGNIPENLFKDKLWYIDVRYPYINATYILHIKINSSTFVPDNGGAICKTLSVFGCKVLDIMKGQVLPPKEKFLHINGELSYLSGSEQEQNENAPLNDDLLKFHQNAIELFKNDSTDIIFEYCNESRRKENNYHPSNYLYNYPDGEPWTKPNKEYIVFLRYIGDGGDGPDILQNRKTFYSILPCAIGNSFGMFPIEDGFVLDEDNYLEFGTSVPIDTFKQRINERISAIKYYGE